ncbi:(Na+)-NQR maturation NqrM [Lachnotalea sp. AF33-28]|uniref:(Na+)-NQR maturation NqrM n=1 Tax=Lachnotalea sp. AF33-28 TaxID=2292046 RepID=UPI000E523979|nr:(Na+)-NQR maturation NqrM [Lachnotalea sp. AF33-28]
MCAQVINLTVGDSERSGSGFYVEKSVERKAGTYPVHAGCGGTGDLGRSERCQCTEKCRENRV